MKKIILILILLVTFGSYSQTTKKNCDCCPKKTKVVQKKKPIKKKTIAIKPIAKEVKEATNITINNVINCPPTQNVVIQKDTIVKIVKYVPEAIISKRDLPIYEIYGGVVKPNDLNALGYAVGFNILPSLHQIDKNGKERNYLNKYLFGIEYSNYKTDTQTFEIPSSTTEPITTIIDCNCTATTFGGFASGSKIRFNQQVQGISLNFGVEVYDGWYLLTGVTSYQHRNIINNEKLGPYYRTYIDGGIKKFIKVGRSYWSPTFKFNSEVITFGLGYSFYK